VRWGEAALGEAAEVVEAVEAGELEAGEAADNDRQS
jgi:hypothetical protein